MAPYRAFISYSHEEQEIEAAVRSALEHRGLVAWSSGDLAPNLTGFTEQIQTHIAHSHVFVPILTPNSHKRGWVHQEIGYAVAMKVPIVPVCIGKLPAGMIQGHEGVKLQHVDQLHTAFDKVRFETLVEAAGRDWRPLSEDAPEPEDRAAMLERCATDARNFLGSPQCVRQAGGFSSFSIPDEPPDHVKWRARWPKAPRGVAARKLLRRERQALEWHAQRAGCRLIVNIGLDTDKEYGAGSKHARTLALLQFLESLRPDPSQVQVALLEKYYQHSLLVVGDWFVAESRAGRIGSGYQQTLFTAHAPSVTRRLAEFDHEILGYLEEQDVAPGDSLAVAIDRLRAVVPSLPRYPQLADGPSTAPTSGLRSD